MTRFLLTLTRNSPTVNVSIIAVQPCRYRQHFSVSSPHKLLGPNSTTWTPATDMLYNTTNGHHQRTSSQQFYNKFATSQCQSPTSRHVKMLGCGKFLSVGGVRNRCPFSGVWALLSTQSMVRNICFCASHCFDCTKYCSSRATTRGVCFSF